MKPDHAQRQGPVLRRQALKTGVSGGSGRHGQDAPQQVRRPRGPETGTPAVSPVHIMTPAYTCNQTDYPANLTVVKLHPSADSLLQIYAYAHDRTNDCGQPAD